MHNPTWCGEAEARARVWFIIAFRWVGDCFYAERCFFSGRYSVFSIQKALISVKAIIVFFWAMNNHTLAGCLVLWTADLVFSER